MFSFFEMGISLREAVRTNRIQEVERPLLENSGNPLQFDLCYTDFLDVDLGTTHGVALLCDAIRNKNRAMIELLIQHGANIRFKDKDQNPIARAIYYVIHHQDEYTPEFMEFLEFLLQEGASEHLLDVGNAGPMLICTVIRTQNLEILKLLFKYGANVEPRQQTYSDNPLICHAPELTAAVDQGNREIVEFLLQHKADPNAETTCAGFPLEAAIRTNNVAMAKLLFQYGADPYAFSQQQNKFLYDMELSEERRTVFTNCRNAMYLWELWDNPVDDLGSSSDDLGSSSDDAPDSSYIKWLPFEVLQDITTFITETDEAPEPNAPRFN